MAVSRLPTSLNPNADPFPYAPPTKLEYLPIPIFKTPPSRVLWPPPPLHGCYQYHHHPSVFHFYDVLPPHLPISWTPSSDHAFTFPDGVENEINPVANNNGDHHWKNMKSDHKKLRIKKWGRFRAEFMPLETQTTTTLMIKNIPNQFRRHHLLNILDEHCKWKNQSSSNHNSSSFDFVYLPMDFRKYWYDGKISNLGYAFVNFTSPTAASEFCEAFHRRQWDVVVNRKVCEIKRAKLQGLKALMEAFRNKIFWCHTNNYLPVVLEPPSDGCCRRYRVTPVGKRIPRPPPSPIKKCG